MEAWIRRQIMQVVIAHSFMNEWMDGWKDGYVDRLYRQWLLKSSTMVTQGRKKSYQITSKSLIHQCSGLSQEGSTTLSRLAFFSRQGKIPNWDSEVHQSPFWDTLQYVGYNHTQYILTVHSVLYSIAQGTLSVLILDIVIHSIHTLQTAGCITV